MRHLFGYDIQAPMWGISEWRVYIRQPPMKLQPGVWREGHGCPKIALVLPQSISSVSFNTTMVEKTIFHSRETGHYLWQILFQTSRTPTVNDFKTDTLAKTSGLQNRTLVFHKNYDSLKGALSSKAILNRKTTLFKMPYDHELQTWSPTCKTKNVTHVEM